MELEFTAYGHEIQVTDIGRPSHMPAGHSKGVVFTVDSPGPLGEVYDSGDGRFEASRDGRHLDIYDSAEKAAKAVVRAALSIRTRAEHVAWCKQRALEYVDQGELGQALASMTSDMRKHDDPDDPIDPTLIVFIYMEGTRLAAADDRAGFRRFIEGFD